MTIPGYVVAAVLLVVGAPVLVPVVAVYDLVRGTRWAGLRLYAFGAVFLLAEMAGLLGSLVGLLVTVGNPRRRDAWFGKLQILWARALLSMAARLFGFRFVVSEDAVLDRPGPILVFARHVSIADTLLPSVFVGHRRGFRLRFVLKRELLWDPCLDVVGHLLRNVFVDRNAADSAREIAAVRALASDMGPCDGLLIYPEGTRFTPQKQERVLARLAERDAARHERVRGLRRVLPVQLGGPSALLGATPDADVVFLAHTGLDAATTLREVVDGTLIGRTVRVAFWRIPRGEVPTDPGAWPSWLDAQWERMDAWVGAYAERSGVQLQHDHRG